MEWATAILAIGGPAFVAAVGATIRWARHRAEDQRELRERVDELEDRITGNRQEFQSGFQQLRGDLRELRRYVFNNRNRR